jgi:hypothetical protein
LVAIFVAGTSGLGVLAAELLNFPLNRILHKMLITILPSNLNRIMNRNHFPCFKPFRFNLLTVYLLLSASWKIWWGEHSDAGTSFILLLHLHIKLLFHLHILNPICSPAISKVVMHDLSSLPLRLHTPRRRHMMIIINNILLLLKIYACF